jgi:L-ascorbate metabolism protein UlaG (beta-lactamase superfamily)
MAATLSVDVALVHVGGVQFPVTGPVRYTMTGRKAVELISIARPRVAFPVHYEGWTHFEARRDSVERALAATSEDVRRRVSWLPIGSPHHVA